MSIYSVGKTDKKWVHEQVLIIASNCKWMVMSALKGTDVVIKKNVQ